MPIVEVTYGPRVSDQQLALLAGQLPHAVSLAVQCPEEPYEPPLRPGDVELRFRPLGRHDVSGLDAVVEVRSKWFESRARDRQRRADLLLALITEACGIEQLGVYLSLPAAAWAQSGE